MNTFTAILAPWIVVLLLQSGLLHSQAVHAGPKDASLQAWGWNVTRRAVFTVNCGNHEASTCENCISDVDVTNGNGWEKCQGECMWVYAKGCVCQAGSYGAECTPCPAGRYSTMVKATSADACLPCGAGQGSQAGSTSCSVCEAGSYSRGGECTRCPTRHYTPSDGAVDSSACLACPEGTLSAGSFCISDKKREWDFRGCTDGVPTEDKFSPLRATAKYGARCSSEGMIFNGHGWVDIDDWEWGGTTSIEVYFKYNKILKRNRMLFDFSTGMNSNNVYLGHYDTKNTRAGVMNSLRFSVRQWTRYEHVITDSVTSSLKEST